MSDREASNYSIQPRYPWPRSPPMGALAAADSYAPSDWPAAEPAVPEDIAGYDPFAAEKYVNPVAAGAIEGGIKTVMTPGKLMQQNPYPPGSEQADAYEKYRLGGEADWAHDMTLNMLGGGAAGTSGEAGTALGAGAVRDPALWHGVSTVKLPKPIEEMSSVVKPINPAAETVINPAKLQGSMLMPLLGDRSAAAAELTRVNGFPFENPVSLEGGHGYMANNPEMAWAAGKSIAPGIGSVVRQGAETGMPVHGVYTAMGERSVDFSHMVSDTLAEMMKHTKVTPEGAGMLNDAMRKIDPNFPGVHSENLAEYLKNSRGDLRNNFAKVMDTAKLQAQGFPSVAEARVAVTDPRLLHEPTGAAGLSIARMDPQGRLGPSGHSTYETGIAGDYIGGLAASVPKEVMFPDVVGALSKHADAVAAARDAQGLKPFRPTEDYLMARTPQGLPRMQEANQQWVDAVSQHLLDRGFTLGSGVTDKNAAAVLQGIRAYHGSPHDFDRFDLSKIGTGEGVQAYGHGLYFADSEKVAQNYRDALSKDGQLLVGDKQFPVSSAGGLGEQNDFLRRLYDRALVDKRDYGSVFPSHYTNEEIDNALSNLKASPELRKWADQFRDQQLDVKPAGKMYEVNINADPEHFLDWDKKVRDMTPEMQQNLIDKGLAAPHGGDIGSQVYHRRVDEFGQETATQQLRDAGIPGIKYLDAGSRSAGEGSRNYVLFNDQLIDILRKYGLAGAAPAGMGALAAQDNYQP